MSGAGGRRSKKRARTDREGDSGASQRGGGDPGASINEDDDVKLCPELQALLGGRKYAKLSELTREVLLKHVQRKGDVVGVKLMKVKVEQFGGTSFGVVLEEGTADKVRDLKRAIEEEQGTPRRHQALFLLDGSGKATSDVPLGDGVALVDESSLVLCLGADESE